MYGSLGVAIVGRGSVAGIFGDGSALSCVAVPPMPRTWSEGGSPSRRLSLWSLVMSLRRPWILEGLTDPLKSAVQGVSRSCVSVELVLLATSVAFVANEAIDAGVGRAEITSPTTG